MDRIKAKFELRFHEYLIHLAGDISARRKSVGGVECRKDQVDKAKRIAAAFSLVCTIVDTAAFFPNVMVIFSAPAPTSPCNSDIGSTAQ